MAKAGKTKASKTKAKTMTPKAMKKTKGGLTDVNLERSFVGDEFKRR